MKKAVLLLFIICLSLSGCRTLKDSQKDYKEREAVERVAEKEVLEEEKAIINTKQETETTTAGISEKTEFYPPTTENPQGGAPKVIERKIYLTDETVLNETSKNYERLLTEKDAIIEDLKRTVDYRESQVITNDSRPVQGNEWLWIGIAFFIVAAVCILGYCLYRKKKR
ncbi:MAG: hypothetical protein LBL79_03410 [Prevotella sp.]|jgi:hypothetical protein|nr:hypothetical protein [Prevotella sp.]